MTEKLLRGEWRASFESPRRACSICSWTTTTGSPVVEGVRGTLYFGGSPLDTYVQSLPQSIGHCMSNQ